MKTFVQSSRKEKVQIGSGEENILREILIEDSLFTAYILSFKNAVKILHELLLMKFLK